MITSLRLAFYCSLSAFLLCVPTITWSASYNDEELYEVLKSANLRSEPNAEASVIEVVPGGHVVALAGEEQSLSDWHKVSSWRASGPVGYIHRSLLREISASPYGVAEYENDLHKIKHFTVQRGSGRLNHVRIYSR